MKQLGAFRKRKAEFGKVGKGKTWSGKCYGLCPPCEGKAVQYFLVILIF